MVGVRRLVEQPVEVRRLEDLTFGQLQAGGFSRFAQCVQLFRFRFFMNPKQQRSLFGDQGFGSCNICQNHEFFNQAMRIKAILERNIRDHAILIEDDFAFRQVEFQRLTHSAGFFQRVVTGIQGPDYVIEQRRDFVIYCAVHCRLNFLIVQRRRGGHQAAHKAVRRFVAIAVDLHFHCDTGARHAFVQRTQITRQTVRQHRHNAVGEIGGIATLARFDIELGPRRDVVRDICNRDPKRKTAVPVGDRAAGIVMIAGVPRIDGDQRQVLQVVAPFKACGFGTVGLRHDIIGKVVGNTVLVDRDQADSTRLCRVAQPRYDARLWQAHAPLWSGLLCLNQLTVLGVTRGARRHNPFFLRALIDRQNTPALGRCTKHT